MKRWKGVLNEEQNVIEETPTEETASEAAQEAEALAPGETETAETPAETDPAALLAEAEAKAAEYLEGWQRERAAFSNYKKRAQREQDELRVNARLDVLQRFLPVLDDFERALASVPDDARGSEWVNGILLIHRKLQSILEAEGVAEIEALGKPFDPNLHEAISQDHDDAYETNHVIEVLQKGYCHGDRVLRPAMVRVAR